MTYAIISVGGKQYRVQEGDKLVVDRLGTPEGDTFSPKVLLVGGEGGVDLTPADGAVTAKVVGELRGPKITIVKYKQRNGDRRKTGFRAALTEIEIASIGAAAKKTTRSRKAAAKPATEDAPAETVAEEKPKPKPKRATKPRAAKTETPAGPEAVADETPAETEEAS